MTGGGPGTEEAAGGASRALVWAGVIAVVALVVGGAAWVGRARPAAPEAPPAVAPGGTDPADAPEDAPLPPPTTGLFEKPVGRWLDVAAVERSGRALRTAEFLGSWLIVDFVFSSCAGTCPRLQEAMHEVQEATKDAKDVRLVSVSVDPQRDTPELLRGWADAWKADRDRWLFLRADAKDVRTLMTDGLRIGGGETLVAHSNLLLLVDPSGALRGRYAPIDHANWREVLLADLARLRAEAPPR